MKHLLIIFSLLLTSISWSEDVDWNDLVIRDGLYYEKFSNEPFTGKVTGLNQGKMKGGKEKGEWLMYRASGQLQFKHNYKDGKLDGEWLWYHENGQLKSKSNYKDGKRVGEWVYYYENGKLHWETNYKDGKEDGERLIYEKNGQLSKTEIWKDDKLIEKIEH